MEYVHITEQQQCLEHDLSQANMPHACPWCQDMCPSLDCAVTDFLWQKGLAEDPEQQYMAQHDGHALLTTSCVPSHCQSTPQMNPTKTMASLSHLVV